MAMQTTMKLLIKYRPMLRTFHVSSKGNGLPTDFFQKSLPYVPLPNLEETMFSYMEIRKAILDPEQFKELEQSANSFLQGDGKELHRRLSECYTHDKFTYFGVDRDINSVLRDRMTTMKQNGGCIVSDVGKDDSQLLRASKLLYSGGIVAKTLRSNSFQPIVMNYNPFFEGVLNQTNENYRNQVAQALGMLPFDMSAHGKLFGTSRIPGLSTDTFRRADKTSKNIVIIRNGHLFSFDLLSENGDIMSIDEIFGTLTKIKEESKIPCTTPISALTCLERTTWAEHRNHLLTDQHNADLVKTIEESIVVCTLDGPFEMNGIEKNIFLGKNPGDRWFDKSSYCSIDECSPLSGNISNSVECHAVVGADVSQEIRKVYEKMGNVEVGHTTESSSLKHLKFNIDDRIESAVQDAKAFFRTFHKDYECQVFNVPELSDKEFKKRFLNPNSMIHLAMQISLLKMYGKPSMTTTVVLVPTFINSHIQLKPEPSTEMTHLVKQFAMERKMEMSSLKRYCDSYYSGLLKMRMGLGFWEEHLCALEELSWDMEKPCEFFGNRVYQETLLGSVYAVTVPHQIAKSVVFSGYDESIGFSYLFSNKGISGLFTTLDSDCPPAKEYSKLFCETLDELTFFISKNTK